MLKRIVGGLEKTIVIAFFPRTAKELKAQQLHVDSVPLKYFY